MENRYAKNGEGVFPNIRKKISIYRICSLKKTKKIVHIKCDDENDYLRGFIFAKTHVVFSTPCGESLAKKR